jgi:CheY-like chemotaxis protein
VIRLRVLLVEDNPDDERLARRALRQVEGIDLDVVHDGQEAIDFLARPSVNLPRLVLLDLKLPKIGGIDVLRWIRSQDATGAMPVVVLTSSDEARDRLECQRLHANSFIQKPVDFDRFLDVFRRTVEYWLTINLPIEREAIDRARMCLP